MVNGRTLGLANLDSFRVIEGRYGLDNARVWLEGVEIDGADPAAFQVLPRGFSHDNAQVWKGTKAVLALTNEEPKIEVHSDHIVTVDDATWLTGLPSVPLPERPVTEPTHFCRHWFAMNDAIWLESVKQLPLGADSLVEAIDCDAGVLTRYEDGEGTEDLSANDGLLLREDATIWQLRLTGQNTKIVTMPEHIAQSQFIESNYDTDPFLLVQGASGMVYAVSLTGNALVQPLGQFDSLPDTQGPSLFKAFWLGDSYFTFVPAADVTDKLVVHHGPAKRFGRYARVGDFLFDSAEVLAVPGDLPVRVVRDDYLLIGNACLSFGNYVTDVPDPTAEDQSIWEQCDSHRRPDTILYDGLTIGFVPQLVDRGPLGSNPAMTDYELGRVSFVNGSDAPYDLPAWFLTGFEFACV